jgi:hypothetical protein
MRDKRNSKSTEQLPVQPEKPPEIIQDHYILGVFPPQLVSILNTSPLARQRVQASMELKKIVEISKAKAHLV